MRYMKIRALATAILLIVCFYSPVVAQQCLTYGPNIVSLTGRLHSRVFPGPPNYESVKKGDRKETALLLTLAKSICTVGNHPPGFDAPETGIHEIQLVVMESAHWKTIRHVRGKRVRVTGTLFHAFTGHHRTKVLIDVTNIRAAA